MNWKDKEKKHGKNVDPKFAKKEKKSKAASLVFSEESNKRIPVKVILDLLTVAVQIF